MKRTVYNSPSDNQDSNQNDGTGGLPEGRGRSPSPRDNLPPELTREEILEQQRIESQIREMNRRRLNERPSNGQAGGTEQWEDFRNVKPRYVSNGVNGQGGNPDNIGFAGARGSQRIAEQIASGAPLDEIIPPQNNNPNTDDEPPQGVDRPRPLRVPEATIREQRVAVPTNTERLDNNAGHVSSFFQRRFLQAFTEREQQNIFQAQQNKQTVQLTPEQQAGQQRILEAQQIVADSLRRAAQALGRAREAQQIALNLQIESTLQIQAAIPITADLPRPAPQPTATQNQGGQSRENTPEPFPIRPPVDRSNFPGKKPDGGRGE
jgi:hypothetical protein